MGSRHHRAPTRLTFSVGGDGDDTRQADYQICESGPTRSDLISDNRDLLVGSRKALAQSVFHLKSTANHPSGINWEQESSHLKLADRHIKEARERIQRQRHLIGRLAKAPAANRYCRGVELTAKPRCPSERSHQANDCDCDR
jgi:hypothetical protein